MDGDQRDDGAGDGETTLPADVVVLLADPSLWADPDRSLEDLVVLAIRSEAPAVRRRWWRDPRVTALAGAAAAALLIGVVLVAVDGEPEGELGIQQSPSETIDMIGTDLAPALSGRAAITRESSGVRIWVRIPGLPRRDGGEFYEGWLRSCDGQRLAPIGTFHDLGDATGWAGVDIDEFPILSFTREVVAAPQGADQSTSGEAVVRGELAPCP